MRSNELYLQVLPIIHLGTGEAEQVLTTASSPESASEFFPDQVGAYINMFNDRSKYNPDSLGIVDERTRASAGESQAVKQPWQWT